MAKIVKVETESQVIGVTQSVWKTILLGLVLGLIYCMLSIAIEKYVIAQLFCQPSQYSSICSQTTAIAGNIATILTAIVGIIFMIKLHMAQPLIVSIACGAALWSIASLSAGIVWTEILFWDLILYILAYVLFSWIARSRSFMTVSIFSLITIAAIRIIINAI